MLTKMIRVINHSSKQLTIKVWEFGAVARKTYLDTELGEVRK